MKVLFLAFADHHGALSKMHHYCDNLQNDVKRILNIVHE